MYIAFYVLLFAILLSISFFDEEKDWRVKVIYAGIGLILFCLAAFKPTGIDNDSLAYIAAYHGHGQSGLDESIEPSYNAICDMIRYTIDVPEAVFFVYALLAMPLKLFIITRFTPLWFLTLLVFMSHGFLLHDMTQIRVNVAIALYFVGLYQLCQGKRMAYLLLVLLASVFHVSALILLPFVFLTDKPLNIYWKVLLALVPIGGYAFYFLHLDVVIISFIPYIQDKIELYEKMRDTGQLGSVEANVFDKVFLAKLAIYYFLLWKYDIIKDKIRGCSLLMKVMSLSYATFCALSFLPVLCGRVSELYGAVEIFLFPLVAYTIRPVWAAKAAVCGIAAIMLMYSLFYMKLIISVS